MQQLLLIDAETPLPEVYERLSLAFGGFRGGPRLSPVEQLIKSLISVRTYDEVAWPAFLRLKARFHPWEALLEAPAADIEAVLAPVNLADLKAGWLKEALGRIVELRGALSLDFLLEPPEDDALIWLRRRLPGVGDKAAAAVLNFSTLRRKAMVVDGHVWRVARRIGLAPRNADPEGVRKAIMAAAPGAWTDEDFFDLHWLLKRLGQTLCMDNRTRCGACPASMLCQEHQRTGGGRKAEVVALALGRKP